MQNQQYAWHMPELEISLGAQYDLREKIILKADVFYLGERYAQKSYSITLPVYVEPHAVKLPAIYDFNIGIEYRYTQRLSAFVNINNITSYRYQKWYQYPNQRLNILGGLTYSF
jgi:outer membrane receptor protein involved in Fe transport